MNEASSKAVSGWSSERSAERPHTRRRDYLPAFAAVGFLLIAHILFGATQPLSAYFVSAGIIVSALVAAAMGGPRHVTAGMIAGALAVWAFGITGLAGNLDRAVPELAVLFAAGSMWTVGFICARSRGALDVAWSGLVWSSLAYCIWMFFSGMAAVMAGPDAPSIADGFRTPADAALIFGLFAVVGWGRVLHVVKQMDAEALARSEMIGRLLRDALGGLLLVGFSVTCLTLIGSQVGVLLTSAVLIAHAWWDMLSISRRQHRGIILKAGSAIAPLIALGLAGWGVAWAWLWDESIAPGPGLGETLPHIQRVEAYIQAWLQQPITGYGIGSIESVGDRAMTLENTKAMLAAGDTQNVFVHWLVETGVVGLAAILAILGAMHVRMYVALGRRKTPRTFLRLAFAAGFLMLLHGLSDSSLDLPSAVWLYALLLGAACGVATGRRSRTHEEE
jgi:O-antigen ligase